MCALGQHTAIFRAITMGHHYRPLLWLQARPFPVLMAQCLSFRRKFTAPSWIADVDDFVLVCLHSEVLQLAEIDFRTENLRMNGK